MRHYIIAVDANSRPKRRKTERDCMYVTHYTNWNSCEEDVLANVVVSMSLNAEMHRTVRTRPLSREDDVLS